MNIESERFLLYLKEIHEDIERSIKAKALSFINVQAYINHIPKKYVQDVNEDWDHEIYVLSDKLLLALYNYSKEMNFISENISFEDFIKQ